MSRGMAWRALFGAGLILLLGGPTPGAVGSCGGDELGGEADVRAYCTEREQLICVRRSLRREITPGQSDDCRREAIQICKARAWAPACRPTERVARACLNALRSLDTVKTPEDRIKECRTSSLCSLHGEPTSLDAGTGNVGAGPGPGAGDTETDDAGAD
jgi:hypothetical protein